MTTDPKNGLKPAAAAGQTTGGGRGLAAVLITCLVVLTIGVAFRVMLDVREAKQSQAQGDGGSLNYYGFDLSKLSVNRDLVSASNRARDKFDALCDPGHITLAELETLNQDRSGKYVLPDDRVIGVQTGGQYCAYPMQVLNWHEAVNDTLGGTPIAVTYNGLADSSVVYDRRLGAATLTFGVSGLVYNCNTVLYDRQGAPNEIPVKLTGKESLWSQVGGVCIGGPRTGQSLTTVPSQVLLWKDWLALHPDTEILRRDPNRIEEYKQDVYGPYFQTDKLEFIVSPPPDLKDRINYMLGVKSPCILIAGPQRSYLLPQDAVLKAAQFDAAGLGSLSMQSPEGPVVVHCRKREAGPAPESLWLDERQSADFKELATAFYFALNSLRPGFQILMPAGQ